MYFILCFITLMNRNYAHQGKYFIFLVPAEGSTGLILFFSTAHFIIRLTVAPLLGLIPNLSRSVELFIGSPLK